MPVADTVTDMGDSVRVCRNKAPNSVPSGEAVAEQRPSGLQPWSIEALPG